MKINTNYTYREMVSFLQEKGWNLDRVEKHAIFSHPEIKSKIVLPHARGNLSCGVVRKTLATANGTYYGANNKKVISNVF